MHADGSHVLAKQVHVVIPRNAGERVHIVAVDMKGHAITISTGL